MEREWRYRGRTIDAADLTFIRELIAGHPQASRCELSHRLCEAWNWKQANGAPREKLALNRGNFLTSVVDASQGIELTPEQLDLTLRGICWLSPQRPSHDFHALLLRPRRHHAGRDHEQN